MSNLSSSTLLTRKTVSAIFRGLDATNSRSSLEAWRTGRKAAMPDPSAFDSSDTFASSYLAYNLARKMEDDVWGNAPSIRSLESEAVSGFLQVENRMAIINSRGIRSDTSLGHEPTIAAVIHTANRKIGKLLGGFDPDEMLARSGFSSGASTRLRKKDGAPHNKYVGKPHVTRNCALMAVAAIFSCPVWLSYFRELYGRESDPCTWLQVVPGSTYFTVPKTSHSLRGAAKEPDMNLYFQKGIGNMLRSRLKRARVDLDDQSRNQYLARAGSRTGALSTVDLSSASDSVSLELCRELLPPDWYAYILRTRSPRVLLPDGQVHEMAKVSSMGNGFTFELESLFFWGLTSAIVDLLDVTDKRIGVYGDDIICHHTVVPTLRKTLRACGFSFNSEKTWVTGPFRESCGGHYFYGRDVSPFNVKRELNTPAERYHLINRYRLWLHRVGRPWDKACSYLLRILFRRGYYPVPPEMGTKAGMLVPNVGEAYGVYFCFETQGYVTRALLVKTPQYEPSSYGAYLDWLDTCMDRGVSNAYVVRAPERTRRGENVTRTRLRRLVASRWSDCEIGSVVHPSGHSVSAGR